MPPNPPNMRSMSQSDMQIPKSEKKNSWPPPPLPNPGDAPGSGGGRGRQYLKYNDYIFIVFFQIKKISQYINFKKFFVRILTPPPGGAQGQLLPPAPSLRHCPEPPSKRVADATRCICRLAARNSPKLQKSSVPTPRQILHTPNTNFM